MSYKDEILKNSGLSEDLNEGISFFKDSKKIESFLNNLRNTSATLEHKRTKSYIMSVYSQLNSNRRKLADLEKQFETADKAEKIALKKIHKTIALEAKEIKQNSKNNITELFNQIGSDHKAGKISRVVTIAALTAALVAYSGVIVYSMVTGGILVGAVTGGIIAPIPAIPNMLVAMGSEKFRNAKLAKVAIRSLSSKIPEVQELGLKATEILNDLEKE